MERDQLADILHRTQDQQEDDMMRLQQHLELQLKQQLQQQYRQVRKVLPTSFLPFVAYFFARVGGKSVNKDIPVSRVAHRVCADRLYAICVG